MAAEAEGAAAEQKPEIARKPYQFLKVDILREYLAMEFRVRGFSIVSQLLSAVASSTCS